MNLPQQRTPADDSEERTTWLQAMAHIWDNARPRSRAQLLHLAYAAANKLGGALILRAMVNGGRTRPEADYISEGLLPLVIPGDHKGPTASTE